jgi:copper chaperone
MENTTLQIEGMSCEHCVKAVTNALNALEGVESVQISLQDNAAQLRYDPSKVTLELIKAAIREEGYEA